MLFYYCCMRLLNNLHFSEIIFVFPIYSTPPSAVPKIIAVTAGIGIMLVAGFLVYKYYIRR